MSADMICAVNDKKAKARRSLVTSATEKVPYFLTVDRSLHDVRTMCPDPRHWLIPLDRPFIAYPITKSMDVLVVVAQLLPLYVEANAGVIIDA
jgi:hypothetical protein